MYNGVCLQLGQSNPVPPSLEGKFDSIISITDGQSSVNHKSWITISEYHNLHFYRLSLPSRHCVAVGWFRQRVLWWLYPNETVCERPGQLLQRKRYKGIIRGLYSICFIIALIISDKSLRVHQNRHGVGGLNLNQTLEKTNVYFPLRNNYFDI